MIVVLQTRTLSNRRSCLLMKTLAECEGGVDLGSEELLGYSPI